MACKFRLSSLAFVILAVFSAAGQGGVGQAQGIPGTNPGGVPLGETKGAAVHLPAAPGHATGAAHANGVFTVTAANATFAGSVLLLHGVPATATWVQYSPGVRAGSLPQEVFTGKSMYSVNHTWLGSPQAVLFGSSPDGNLTKVVLQLDDPVYNRTAASIAFMAAILEADPQALPLTGGAANYAAKDGGALASEAPKAPLSNATLVVDTSDATGYTSVASTELITLFVDDLLG